MKNIKQVNIKIVHFPHLPQGSHVHLFAILSSHQLEKNALSGFVVIVPLWLIIINWEKSQWFWGSSCVNNLPVAYLPSSSGWQLIDNPWRILSTNCWFWHLLHNCILFRCMKHSLIIVWYPLENILIKYLFWHLQHIPWKTRDRHPLENIFIRGWLEKVWLGHWQHRCMEDFILI